MKYLSWDIGIKNLSYCLMDDKMEINAWEVLDISGEDKTEYLCKEIQKNKNICNKKANFHNLINHNFYCNKHSKDFKDDIMDIHKIRCSHKTIKGDLCGKKISYNTNIKFIGYCKTHSKNHQDTELIEIKKESKCSLNDISINLIKLLDSKPSLLEANIITIENQPAFKNPRMKSIQMIIYTYFNIRGRIDVKDNGNYIERILFLAASNKLKVNFDNKAEVDKTIVTKNKYKRNKELAKLYCLEFVKDPDWIEFFDSNKKKDDLADTYLMNIYQIQIDTK